MDERGAAVVIEDDADIRALLVGLLTQSGFQVHEAGSGADGVRAVTEHNPVIVTVDLGLPDIDGFEVTRRVRRISDAYVLMLTARADEIDTLMGLDAGADDYVTKPFRPRELRARIEAMLRRPRMQTTPEFSPESLVPAPDLRHQPTPYAITARSPESAPRWESSPGHNGGNDATEIPYRLDGLELFPGLYKVVVDGRDVQLTPTEFTLLRTLLVSRRVVRSKPELFRILRDEEPDSGTFVSESDERTIEVHMGNLRRKLGDDPRQPRWVETLRGVGYRMAGIPDLRSHAH
ncbi:response regulator transcription factor [Tessaracoccus sp. OS52]|uniref:response regulator transcription factor n=1 Tax=Tessaracoccus sp. OS52 TaxID=2886691 RepID=UPI001D105CD2|nr:response regulator transcription factor [Tessaracoccus sp. OS52]MCC2594708.1 response regulator transcription factor [Tessaracoccus sp. OS52]